MRTIKWTLDIGLVTCERSGEVEVEDNATDEEIEASVREDVFQYIDWSWSEKPKEEREESALGGS